MDGLNRRDVVTGLVRLPLAALPLAAILADPRLARAAADTLATKTLDLPSGRRVSAALAEPDAPARASVLLIHEWWGLNDQIKSVAFDFAKQGYRALAVDLYGGRSTTSREEAPKLMGAVNDAEALETLTGWADWLALAGPGLALGTVGWCFGGSWSLKVSTETPVDATVIYYGRVDLPAARLENLVGPVLGHFAEHDKWINHEMIAGFEANMDAAGKELTVHWYDADHAFANPTSARYDEPAASLAWERTTGFFAENLS